MADASGKAGPTATEALFFFNIVQHMKNKGDIDWDAVADSSGFKNAGVAKVRFGQIKRKYGLDGDSPSKKPSKSDNAGDLPPTPTKVTKSRKGGGGRGRAVKKEEPEDEDGGNVPFPGVKRENEDEQPFGPPVVKGEDGSAAVKEEKTFDGFNLF